MVSAVQQKSKVSTAVPMAGVDWSALRARLEQYGQEHLLQFLEELTEAQKEELHSDISEVDLGRVTGYFQVCPHCRNAHGAS